MDELKKLYLEKYSKPKVTKALPRDFFNNIDNGIAIYEYINNGSDFIFKDFNKAAEKIDKIKKKDLIGKSIKEIFPGIVEFGLFDMLKRVYKTGKPEKNKLIFYKDNGITGYRENYVFKLPSGEVAEVYKDLTKQKQTEAALKAFEEDYKGLFERSIDGIYRSTLEGKYIDVNPALVKMLGYKNKIELLSIDIPTQLYASKNDRPKTAERNRVFETKLKKKDGSVIYVSISSRAVYKNNKPVFYEGIVRDVTKQKEIEKQLKFLSFHDKLTGLYNRAYFEEELKRLDSARQLPLSIIVADINGLKLTNDAFGHKEGDLLLCKAAGIFKKCFRKEDIIARWDGDEFIMLLPKTTEKETVGIINRIEEDCLKTDKLKIPASISMGGSTKTTTDKDINEVILGAEEWMYQRKLTESNSFSNSIINSFTRILLEKSIETEEHTGRVKALALQLGKALNFTKNELTELSLLADLHDIGKVAIPEELLLKKDRLSKAEWMLIKKHPTIGYNIIKTTPHLSHIADYILAHHEWWNGSGYPQGLKGNEIPLPSRILAIVDAYDVMIGGRPYKSKMDIEKIVEEFKRFSGKQFDPYIVEKFLDIIQ